MGVGGQRHAPTALPPVKRLVGYPSWSGCFVKKLSLFLAGIQTSDNPAHKPVTILWSFFKSPLVLANYSIRNLNKVPIDICCFFSISRTTSKLYKEIQTLTVRFLLGSNFLENDKVLMSYFRCYVHVLRFHRHEICFPMLDLVQAIHSLKLIKC